MEPIISLDHVSKHFVLQHLRAASFQDAVVGYLKGKQSGSEVFYALRDVSFELREGESLGIIGRNGSGKSTILKVISRILEPNSGRVVVHGKVSALIELGAGFHPDLTGRENIFLYGSILGIKRREMARRFDSIVDFSELDRFIDTPVKHYSSGMYARLGFAVAISVDPRILIVDEVLSVGDEAFQHKCLERIRELRAQGVSIVLVSHGLDTVRNFCERAIWIADGGVRMAGTAYDVVDQYVVSTNVADDAGAGEAVRPPRVADEPGEDAEATGRRWGSGEVAIWRVELLDTTGEARGWFTPAEALVVRMHYRAPAEVRKPVFGIALYSSHGLHIGGPNTSASDFFIDNVRGSGWVDCVLDPLSVTPGHYEVSAAVYDQTQTHPYDHHHRLYHFEVKREAVGRDYGVVRLPVSWRHVARQARLEQRV